MTPRRRSDGAPTARCLILVTPDGERTMNTFLGASVDFRPEDLDLALIDAAKIVYLEGYLFDRDEAKSAFREAARAARQAGAKVALTLSDAFCVDRHRDDFRALVREGADIVFANEKEITSLYQVNSFEEAADAALQDCEMAVLTRSEAGSVIVAQGETIEIEADPARSGRPDRRRRPLFRGLPLWADPGGAAGGLRALGEPRRRRGDLAYRRQAGNLLAQAGQGKWPDPGLSGLCLFRHASPKSSCGTWR